MRHHYLFFASAIALGLAACVTLPEQQTSPLGAAGDSAMSGVGGISGGGGSTAGAGTSGSGTAGVGGTSGSGTGGAQGAGAGGDGGVGGAGGGIGGAGAGGATAGGGAGGTTVGAGTGAGGAGGAGSGGNGGVGGAGSAGKGGSGGAGAAGKGGTAGGGGAGSGGAGSGGAAGNGGAAAGKGGTGGAGAGSGGAAGGLVELAEGRTATSDSEEVDPMDDPPKDNTAAKGNDGDAATRWCAADGMPHWWQVDLGASHSLSRIEIDFEYPPQAVDTAYTYVVAVSADGATFTTVIDQSDNMDTMTTQVASFPASTSGRYVRVTVTPPVTTGSATWASLWEARIYGQ